MNTLTVRLSFPLERVQEPVVTRLVRDFDILPNVLAANIESGKGGWMLLGLEGQPGNIDKALTWIEGVGVHVEREAN